MEGDDQLGKPIRISSHARRSMMLRGATEEEVKKAIRTGQWKPAKRGKFQTKHRFRFGQRSPINQRVYSFKTVEAVFAEHDELVVVTVKVYYSGEVAT